MIKNVDHIGIAVPDLGRAVAVYRDVIGLEKTSEEDVPEQKVRVAKFAAGPDVIELVAPSAPDSPIAGFLARRGGGLHHICLAVDDIEVALERAKKEGARLIDTKPRMGAGGCRVAFIHPSTTAGVLIELSEAPR